MNNLFIHRENQELLWNIISKTKIYSDFLKSIYYYFSKKINCNSFIFLKSASEVIKGRL